LHRRRPRHCRRLRPAPRGRRRALLDPGGEARAGLPRLVHEEAGRHRRRRLRQGNHDHRAPVQRRGGEGDGPGAPRGAGGRAREADSRVLRRHRGECPPYHARRKAHHRRSSEDRLRRCEVRRSGQGVLRQRGLHGRAKSVHGETQARVQGELAAPTRGGGMKRLAFFVAALAAAAAAAAQGFPSRAVTIVVPYPPGGLIDLVARTIQPRMQTELGRPVLVENRSGAGGNVGAEAVARAPADGYTLLLANPSLGISPHMYSKLPYSPLKDFAYVGLYGTVPNVLVVHPSLPANSVQELVDYLKKNPGRLNYASPGYGTSPQMSMELFKGMTETFIVHIPFRGSGPAQAAMLAGETQLMFDNLPPQVPHIKSGRVRALAVTSLKRSPVFPDVPTLDEAGLKGYEVTAWFGLAAPAATPREAVLRLNEALNHTTQDPQVRAALESRGATVIQGTPEDC